MVDVVTKTWRVCGVAGESKTQLKTGKQQRLKMDFKKTKTKNNDLKACSRR